MSGPDIPDAQAASVEGLRSDVANFPFRYKIEALAKLGGKQKIGGKVYDFTGLGDADNARVMSDKMAQTFLDIQKNYGADFIKQRLADLERSDPSGFSARKELFAKIMDDVDKHPDRPIAEDLQNQINSELTLGGKLDNRETEQVQQGVRGKQLHNGLFLGNAPASEEANTLVQASEAQETQRQNEAMNYLKSGVSPEDVEYRRIQQALGNLGAFVNGQNPIAEFGSLSGAQNGAAPFTATGNNSQATNPNAALEGVQNAYQQYSGMSQWSNQQANPFLVGLNAAGGVFGAAGNLGAFSAPSTSYSNTVNTGGISNQASATYTGS